MVLTSLSKPKEKRIFSRIPSSVSEPFEQAVVNIDNTNLTTDLRIMLFITFSFTVSHYKNAAQHAVFCNQCFIKTESSSTNNAA